MDEYNLTLNYTNVNEEEKSISLHGVFLFEILYSGRNKCVLRKYSNTAPLALQNQENNIVFDTIDLSDFTTQCTNVSVLWGENNDIIFSANNLELVSGSYNINYGSTDNDNGSPYDKYSYIEHLEFR